MGLLSTKKSLTLAAAKEIGAAAEAEARKNNFTNCVAIFDDGGNLLYLVTMDGTQTGSIDVAQQKGLAALRFKRSTKLFQEMVTLFSGSNDSTRNSAYRSVSVSLVCTTYM